MSKKIISLLLAAVMVIVSVPAFSAVAMAGIEIFDGDDDTHQSHHIDFIDGEDDEYDEIADPLALISSKIKKYSENTVTSDDLAELESIASTAASIAANPNATAEQKSKAQAVGDTAASYIKKVNDAVDAYSSAKKAADAIVTVTSSNVAAANAAVSKLDAAMKSDNLTAAQKSELAAKKADLENKIKAYNSTTTTTKPTTPTTPTQPQKPTTTTAPKAKKLFALDSGLNISVKESAVTVKWQKVADADGYMVYAQYCGKDFSKKATKTVKGAKNTSVKITKIGSKKLDAKKNYKIYVVAYKNVDGRKKILGKTVLAHVAGAKSKKYTNVKSVSTSKSSYTLKKNKTATIKAKQTLVNSKKSALSSSHAKKFRYKSSDTKVAKVDSNGKIKAVGKGKCTVYVYAVNGKAAKVTVTVE